MYCEFEATNFPIGQFVLDPELGWIHKREPRHTVAGNIVPYHKDVKKRTSGVPLPDLAVRARTKKVVSLPQKRKK
jgi:hypothetical protein